MRTTLQGDGNESGSEYEYEYDEEGNIVKQKRIFKKVYGMPNHVLRCCVTNLKRFLRLIQAFI